MAKREDKPRVTIAYRCEKCGRIFARCHPKDPQTLYEKCRKEKRCIQE